MRAACDARHLERAAESVTSHRHAPIVPASPAWKTATPEARRAPARLYRAIVRTAALLALVALAAGCGGSAASSGSSAATAHTSPFRGAELPSPKRAPDFVLRDQHGASVRLSDQRGRYVLVTFLYTHCPDVCPVIAANLNTALRTLGPLRSRVRVLAVSVDPQGDTPAAVRAYARRLRLLPQFHYLIGPRPALMRVWRDYGVLAVARDKELVDHTASTVLVDSEQKRRVLYDAHVRAGDVVHDLRRLLGR
jgi:protein SCO1